jgi:hypothetical protein
MTELDTVRETRTVINAAGCLPPLWVVALPLVLLLASVVAQLVIYG